jgi:cold shock CspA family protein
VRRNSDGTDIFVHLRELTDGTMSLEEGQTVEFDIKKNEKGEMAYNVTVHNES